MKKCLANSVVICGSKSSTNLLPLLPALSKIMRTDSATGEDVGESLVLNENVLERLVAFLEDCAGGELPSAAGVMWGCDVLEAGARWMSRDVRSSVAGKVAALMPAAAKRGPPDVVDLVYLVRAFFNVCGGSTNVRLNDTVVGQVRGACELVFSGRMLAVCSGGDHSGNFTDLCYMIETGRGKGELLELVCGCSGAFEDIRRFVQQQSLLS